MGVRLALFRVSPSAITSLTADPKSARAVLDGLYVPSARDAGVAAFDLDKTWNVLHYLLTGRDRGGEPPLSFLSTRAFGIELRGVDSAYDPPMLISPAQTVSVARGLTGVKERDLRARCDPRTMALRKVYPFFFEAGVSLDTKYPKDKDEETAAHYLDVYRQLTAFVRNVATAGSGLVIEWY